ncbi:hypothetical protein [Candidatus Neptunichlamydia sp. REUL1]|uniref:hypothetical protein n=1 Tax=Candidatus Neptunichlamydia sp. REUL1 TaxID=3064277 RepID=UPI0029305B57|nr:hypothetical protein [Candidatus Neptunochlamydia sp. REUL1]
MVARIDSAFHHFGNGSDRYVIHNVTRDNLSAYDQAYKAKVQKFYEEVPFAEERIVSRSEFQADPFYIKYQNKNSGGKGVPRVK